MKKKLSAFALAALMGLSLTANAVEVPEYRTTFIRDFQTKTQHIRSVTAKSNRYGEMLVFWNKPKPYGHPSADRLLTNGEPEDGLPLDGKCGVDKTDFQEGSAKITLEFYRGPGCDAPSHPEGAIGEIRTFSNGQWAKDFLYRKDWQFK